MSIYILSAAISLSHHGNRAETGCQRIQAMISFLEHTGKYCILDNDLLLPYFEYIYTAIRDPQHSLGWPRSADLGL